MSSEKIEFNDPVRNHIEVKAVWGQLSETTHGYDTLVGMKFDCHSIASDCNGTNRCFAICNDCWKNGVTIDGVKYGGE